MQRISFIFAVDTLGGMGKDNHLLCHLPADLKYFKEKTEGKPIVMGRRTFDSIGRALPNRLNIVLSHQELMRPDITVAHSLTDAFNITRDAPEVMLIGGAAVFQQALPFVSRIYQTKIHYVFDSDVFFPDINWTDWVLVSSKDYKKDEKNAYDMTFNCYELASFGHKAKNK